MSDWELDNTYEEKPSTSSEWEIESPSEKSGQKIGYGQALMQAPGKIWEDVSGAAINVAKKIPEYYESAKTEIPGAFNLREKNPKLAEANRMAGMAQLGQNVFNTPHDFINYLTQRLNLFPEDINKMIQMGRMPADTQQMINERFGVPSKPGEALLRGAPQAAFDIGTGASGFRLINALRPSEYIKGKAHTISNEYKAAKSLERNTFAKVFDIYGDNLITATPKKYLSNMGIDRSKLLHDAKFAYDEVLKNPTLKNIHKLQSQIGGDANKVFENYPNKYQRFREYKNKLMDDTQNYLGKIDENALSNYNLGRQITRDVVSPFTSNTTLEQVSKGVYPNVSDKELKSAIQKGKRDIIYEKEGKPVTAIHPEHKLSHHLIDIEKRLSKINMMKYLLAGTGIGLGGLGIANKFLGSIAQNNQ